MKSASFRRVLVTVEEKTETIGRQLMPVPEIDISEADYGT